MSWRFELAAALWYFLVAPLVAGEPKEVVARWEELAPLIEKREIETVLANGVHIRGRVEKVLPEALEVRVKRTSEPKVLPKGPGHVSRDLLTVITVRWRQGPYRLLLPIALLVGLASRVIPASPPDCYCEARTILGAGEAPVPEPADQLNGSKPGAH